MKHLLAITIVLFPSAALAQQFTPQQMLKVMTRSPSNRDIRVHDSSRAYTQKFFENTAVYGKTHIDFEGIGLDELDAPYLKGSLLRDLSVQKYKVP